MSASRRGYLLIETAVAIAVLSIGAVGVHFAMQQVLVLRALSEDYTKASFLLDSLVREIEVEPRLAEQQRSGNFDAPYQRFSYSVLVDRVQTPLPDLPIELPRELREAIEEELGYMGRITATVRWSRRGEPDEVSISTLVPPRQFWTPEEAQRQ